MTNVRQYFMGFLYRTALCLILLLLCYIIYMLWPELFYSMREKLFYEVNYGRLIKELQEAAVCLIPS